MLGDGHTMENGTRRYDTSSVDLANDFQRLCLHAGFSTNIAIKYKAGKESVIKKEGREGVVIRSTVDAYRMTIVEKQNSPLVNKNIDSLSYDVVKKMCKKRKLDIITLDDYNAMLQRQMGFVLEPYIRDKKGIPNNLYELMSKEPSIAKKMDISFFAESNSLIDSILVSFKNWSGPPSKTYRFYVRNNAIVYQYAFDYSGGPTLCKVNSIDNKDFISEFINCKRILSKL
jgi:hypothetical protein